MMQLHEQYRPHTLSGVVGQAKAVKTIFRLAILFTLFLWC